MMKESTKAPEPILPVKFLTVKEFAARIGVHPQTVRQWDADDILKPHHKTPSGRRLYTIEQVDEYFNRK